MGKSPITRNADGTCSWSTQDGDTYQATGILRSGRRMEPITSSHWHYINGLNIWRGTKWLVRDGKRYVIQAVTN